MSGKKLLEGVTPRTLESEDGELSGVLREQPQHGKPSRVFQPMWFWVVLAAVLATGLVLRIAGSVGELWFDELWSLVLVAPLKTPMEVFTRVHHDNNHYLVSLWIWLCGTNQAWWVYRAPSVVAGMGACVAAVWIGLRQSRVTAIIAGGLVSFSYLAVVYSSEARGYAIACCMTLVGYGLLENYLCDRSLRSAARYGLAIVVGMLGHLSYVSVAIALGVWSFVAMMGRERKWRAGVQWFGLHAGPMAILGVLWWLDVRKMTIGGGPELRTWQVLRETIDYAFGLPSDFRLGGVLAVAVFMFIAWQTFRLARSQDLRWIFFATALVFAPAALLIITARAYLYPRYFLVQVYLVYLLIALAAGRAWENWGPRRRWSLAGLLTIWALANGSMSVELARIGRGHFKEALQYIAANTPAGHPTIALTQDFRSAVLINYYQKFLPPSETPGVMLLRSVPGQRPEWILATMSPYEWPTLPQTLVFNSDLEYVLVKEFPSVKVSGLPAGVYRRADLRKIGDR